LGGLGAHTGLEKVLTVIPKQPEISCCKSAALSSIAEPDSNRKGAAGVWHSSVWVHPKSPATFLGSQVRHIIQHLLDDTCCCRHLI